jgi:hypothetical protein
LDFRIADERVFGPVGYQFIKHNGRSYSPQELNSGRFLTKGWRPTKSDHLGVDQEKTLLTSSSG